MEKHYNSVGDFAKDFGPQMAGWLGRARTALLDEAFAHVDQHSRREPVGTGPRYKGGKAPGALKASRTVIKTGEDRRIGWSAPHAIVINRGRKRSKPYSRALRKLGAGEIRGRRGKKLGAAGTAPFTRMLGSKQARGGMTRPAFAALRRDWGSVIEKAVVKTEAGA